jgi:hypothetical protein
MASTTTRSPASPSRLDACSFVLMMGSDFGMILSNNSEKKFGQQNNDAS